MKLENISLQEELHQLKKRGDGHAFGKNDTAKAIAIAVISAFNGLSTKVSRVETIARELNAWVNQKKMAEREAIDRIPATPISKGETER